MNSCNGKELNKVPRISGSYRICSNSKGLSQLERFFNEVLFCFSSQSQRSRACENGGDDADYESVSCTGLVSAKILSQFEKCEQLDAFFLKENDIFTL